MNKVIIVLSLFLLLMAGVVFYELSQANKTMNINGKVTIGKQIFDVEVAKEDKAKQIGLTKYSSLKDNQGMLFAFDSPQEATFWMKNMKFPIDIIFIRDNTIVSVVEKAPIMDQTKDPVYYSSNGPVNFVLEIKADLIKKYGIKTGDTVKIEIK